MKNSPFNPANQNNSVDSRIVAALERISEVFRVLLWQEGKENSLSPTQIQLLIFIRFHSSEKCKISYLADEFNMTKATISDCVKTLLAKQLIEKELDPADTRSYTLSLTTEGIRVANQVSLFTSALDMPIASLTNEQKSVMLEGLLKLIHDLHKAGIITIQRMCSTCSYHSMKNGKHYCTLLKTKLSKTDIRLDCPEHELVN